MSQNHTGDCTLAHYAAIARNRRKPHTLPQWCNLTEGWDKKPGTDPPPKKEHAEHDGEKEKEHDADTEHGNKPL